MINTFLTLKSNTKKMSIKISELKPNDLLCLADPYNSGVVKKVIVGERETTVEYMTDRLFKETLPNTEKFLVIDKNSLN